jgi:hypothetical protein
LIKTIAYLTILNAAYLEHCMLTQYENNRNYYVVTMVMIRQMCHFTVKNEPKTLLAAILNFQFQPFFHMAWSLYLAIFLSNMKTLGPTLTFSSYLNRHHGQVGRGDGIPFS